MLIGVTGGIGCGKTRVARLLSENLTARYTSSDEICRELLVKDQPGYLQFVRSFGDRFLDDEKNIDRALLRTHIFSDDISRQQLESILHPLVHKRILTESRKVDVGRPVIAEVPLLFECGWEHDFDGIVCVTASRDTVIERIMARDCVSRTEAGRIIDVQMDLDEKATRSDWIIDNDGDYDQTRLRLVQVAEMIRGCSEK